MSKEINIHFNTIFWIQINYVKINIYVTKLKSRIYKAIQQKSFAKLFFLQETLYFSISVKYLAAELLSQIKSKYLLDIYSEQEYIFVVENKKFDYDKKYKSCNKIMYYIACLKQIIFVQMFEVQLKSTLIDRQHLSFTYVKNDHTLVQKLISYHKYLTSKRLSCCSINLKDFWITISITFMISRLFINQSIVYSLKQCLQSITVTKKFNKEFLDDSTICRYRYSTEHQLFIIIKTVIVHSILLESCYIISNFSRYTPIRFFSLSAGSQVILASKSMTHLKYLLEVLRHVSLQNIFVSQKEIVSLRRYYCIKYVFCGYAIYHKHYRQIVIRPSKTSQKNLLKQVNSILSTRKVQKDTDVIGALNLRLQKWFNDFYHTQDYKSFSLINYLVLIKIAKWLSKNHSDSSKNLLKCLLFKMRKSNKI